MPSKRKERLREDARFEDGGWFEISTDLWLEPGEKPRKLRLLADANFPFSVVEILRKRGIEVRTAQQLDLHRLPDEQILHEAVKRGQVLITKDRDFLSERRFPLHSSGRVVFIDGDGDSFANTTGFELLIFLLKSWGGSRGYGKIRATSEGVLLKFHATTGQKYTEKKRVEKLRYMHRNPVTRGLVSKPWDWPWSSFRHHLSGHAGTVEIESEWTAARRERATAETHISARCGAPAPGDHDISLPASFLSKR